MFTILTGIQCYSLWLSFHKFSRQHEFFGKLFSLVLLAFTLWHFVKLYPGLSFNVVTHSLAILCVTCNLWLVSSCLYPSLVFNRPFTNVFGTIQTTINLNQVSGTITFYHKTLSSQYQLYHSFTVEYDLIPSICQFNLVFKCFFV